MAIAVAVDATIVRVPSARDHAAHGQMDWWARILGRSWIAPALAGCRVSRDDSAPELAGP